MNQISVLSQETIDKIAAGEVVERPSSIVKELVENSIDAGANAVTVEIRDGGTSLIRITDNGSGIPREEVPVAFLRHATSKIRTVEDLVTAGTLGFRGEALSSIAAIAQVELITKTAGSLTGTRYLIDGGIEKGLEEIGAPEGTTFLVRNMFYNTPARKKFLKSTTTEAGYISDLMERLALSHPDISFKFMNQGQTRLHTSGNCRLRDVIYGIYGREITANLLPIEVDCGYLKLHGMIGKPVISRGNRNYENYFVNGRFVRSNLISRAIEEAYKPFMMNHRYPFTVLSLEIEGDYLDANVHPTKMEVRFSDQVYVYEQVYQAVKDTLAGKELIPEISLEKQPRTGEKQMAGRNLSKTGFPEPFEQKRREMIGEGTVPYRAGQEEHHTRVTTSRTGAFLKPITGNITQTAGDGPKDGTGIGTDDKKNAQLPAEHENALSAQQSSANTDTTPWHRSVGCTDDAAFTQQPSVDTDTMPEKRPTGCTNTAFKQQMADDTDTDCLKRTASGTAATAIQSSDVHADMPSAQIIDTREDSFSAQQELTDTCEDSFSAQQQSTDRREDFTPAQQEPADRREDFTPAQQEPADRREDFTPAQQQPTATREDFAPAHQQPTDTREYSSSVQQQSADTHEKSSPVQQESQTPVQMQLFDDKLLSRENVREHKLIGQVFDTYWIVEFRDKMYIIDQHAAHEKVIYERFMKQLAAKQQTSQQLCPPLILTLSMQEEQLLERFRENFESVGFEIEPFGGREYSVRAVPGNLYGLAEKELFLEMLDGLSDLPDHAAAELINDKIATMSCKAAVKGNNRLSMQEADALIAELLGLENPYNCPHGRPTIISMTKYELEKKFKRVI